MKPKLPMKNKPEKPQRIPKGSIVEWRARYSNDPLNRGVVTELPKDTTVFHAPRYRVRVTHVNGHELKTSKVMTPYAKNLEYQNPKLVKKQ